MSTRNRLFLYYYLFAIQITANQLLPHPVCEPDMKFSLSRVKKEKPMKSVSVISFI